MASVVQSFDRFLRDLEPTEAESAEIVRRQKLLVERLSRNLDIRQDLLAGAYARNTAIRPLNDVDLLLVLDEGRHGDLREQGPSVSLEAIRSALLAEGPLSKEQIELKGRGVSVTVGLAGAGAGVGLVLVPAFEETPGVYAIPDRDHRGWITTNPGELSRVLNHAHERAAAKLIPVIRAAKHWSARHGMPIAGLHLEALAPKAIPTPPLSYPQALRQFFAKLTDLGQKACPDPGGTGPDLDAEMSQEEKGRLRLLLQDATRQIDQALQFDRTWRAEEAHAVWRSLLGTAYPESGKR